MSEITEVRRTGCSKRLSSEAAGESKPEAYPLGYVEDFDEPRTTLEEFFSTLLGRSIQLFGCHAISREGRGIDLLQQEIGMPNELPLEPLARHPLISQLNPYLIQIPLQLLHPPLTQPGDLIAFAHRTHMLSHRLKNCGIALSLMGLHQREGFGGPTISYEIRRRRLHPEIVEQAQHEHCHDRIVNDLHNQGECAELAEE